MTNAPPRPLVPPAPSRRSRLIPLDLRLLPVLLTLLALGACAGGESPRAGGPPSISAPDGASGELHSPALVEASASESCFPLDALSEDDRALADSLVAGGLDNEGLFTLAGGLKPMSTLDQRNTGLAAPDDRLRGHREVVDPEHPDLADISRVHRVLQHLHCGPIRALLVPFQAARDTVRSLQVVVIHQEALNEVLDRDRSFWGQWALAAGADPGVVVSVVEHAHAFDRWRGYGYLFGYPEHAVTFFTEAGRTAEEEGAFVERDFFEIPVHSERSGRFVYAVPEGHEPGEDDEAIRARAAEILEAYRARRASHQNPDGTLRAVELLRDWYREG